MGSRSNFGTDFTLLKPLQVLLEQRSVSRAAEQLGISQPAMSRILARLRDQFQDQLLVRGRNGMMLTPRAENLRAPLVRWLSEGDRLMSPATFNPARDRKAFRVASSDFGVLSVVTPAIAQLEHEAPDCSLVMEPLTDASLRRLSEGEIDLVITGYDPEGAGLDFRLLFSDHYLGLARPDHPVHDRPPTREALLDWPHVVTTVGPGLGDWIAEALPEIAFGRGVLQSNSFSLTPYMVAAGNAVAILPSRAAQRFARTHGLKTFEIPLRFAPLDYVIVWHARSRSDPATQWMINLLTKAEARTPASQNAFAA